LKRNNLIVVPSDIGNLQPNTQVDISFNQLTTIPSEFAHLVLWISNNPIEYLQANIRRNIDRLGYYGIYNDLQSVHDSTIQHSIKKSISNILNVKQPISNVIPSVLLDDILSETTKKLIIEYLEDYSIVSELNVTFSDVFTACWNRIAINKNSNEIKRILNIEIHESICKCFTGRISRIVNCLSGFDELVQVKISDNEQIGNVISAVRNRLDPYDLELHKKIVRIELQQLKYPNDIIDNWIYHIQ
jgi:hypothetical protein